MVYIIEKNSGTSISLYKVTSYWDPAKKQPRQKREYLGRKDPKTGNPVRVQRATTPRLAKDYGHVYLLQSLAEHLGLTQVLKTVFPNDYQTFLALAFFEISEATPLYLFPSWVESTFLYAVKPLRSGELTKVTQKMGRMERERLKFCHQWVKTLGLV